MRFQIHFQDQNREVEIEKGVALLGRPNAAAPPDLDLSPDTNVSRQHARIWMHAGRTWIEDLKSRTGTFVNDVRIDAPSPVLASDRIRLGETVLIVENVEEDLYTTIRIDHNDTEPNIN
jgi:pSer/pThr/pTyr-binding forkhead associated (FHA) protein